MRKCDVKKNKFTKTKVRYRLRKDLKLVANKYRKELIVNATKAELLFKYILDKLGIAYKFQFIIYTSKSFYIVDFFLPMNKVIFEVDGKHHYLDDGIAKDVKRDLILFGLGYEVKRFKNSEVYIPRKCEKRIRNILGIKQNKYF